MTQVVSDPPSARPLIELIEQARCPNEACDAVIQRELIWRNLDRDDPTRRTIKAYCRHCQRAYVVRQQLVAGSWRDEGSVEIHAEGSQFRGIKARAEHVLSLTHNE